MKRRSLRIGALSIGITAWVALTTFACSSSNTGSGGNASTATNFISAYCSYIGSCCGSQSLPSDGSQCRALLGFEVNSSAYDPVQGQSCLNAVSSASNGDPAWCVDQTTTTNTACNGAFGKTSGNIPPGGKCSSDSDCAPGPSGDTVICQFPPFNNDNDAGGSANQICVVQAHGKAGDGPCAGTVQQINGGTSTTFNNNFDAGAGTGPQTFCFSADGVTCDETSSKCVALGQIGDSCSTVQCVTGAHCDFTNNETCAANAATGAACQFDTDCITGDYCNTTGGNTCAAQVASGAACTTGNQCTSGDCSTGKCGAGFGAAFGLALLCGSADGG